MPETPLSLLNAVRSDDPYARLIALGEHAAACLRSGWRPTEGWIVTLADLAAVAPVLREHVTLRAQVVALTAERDRTQAVVETARAYVHFGLGHPVLATPWAGMTDWEALTAAVRVWEAGGER